MPAKSTRAVLPVAPTASSPTGSDGIRPSGRKLTPDQGRGSSRGPDWFTDAYTLSPGATDLLTLAGAEHSLGGISGYEVAETTDENPERVALLRRMTTAYLKSALDSTDTGWEAVRTSLNESSDPLGHVDSK